MIAPPGPVVAPGGSSEPRREEETPTGMSRSPTCRMIMRRFALRFVAASAAASFACQSGRIASVVVSDRAIARLGTLTYCNNVWIMWWQAFSPTRILVLTAFCTSFRLFTSSTSTLCCSCCIAKLACQNARWRCTIDNAELCLLAERTCCGLAGWWVGMIRIGTLNLYETFGANRLSTASCMIQRGRIILCLESELTP